MKIKLKYKVICFFSICLIAFTIFIYSFDKIVTPTVLTVADAEMRAKAIEIINSSIIEEYRRDFNYDEVIKIEKDRDGNITLLKADTLKLNEIACNVSINSQKKIQDLGNIGIGLPLGYIFKNNIFAYLGPSIPIKMQPIGHIETSYSSEFESAGINQTRHRIYVLVKTRVRVIIPMESNDIEVKNEIPICETIIVGKIPDAAINLDLSKSGFTIPNSR